MEGSLVAYKVFTNGSVLQASEINDNLMRQSVMVFSNAAARTAAITSPLEGMLTWLEDVNRYESYNGTAWVSAIGYRLLASSTFSAVTGFSPGANTFTSAFRNYKIFIELTASVSAASLGYRMELAGSGDTSNQYLSMNQGIDANGNAQTTIGTSTIGNLIPLSTASFKSTLDLTIFEPALAAATNITGLGVGVSTSGAAYAGWRIGARHNVSTAYDNIGFFPSSGNVSGRITVYGLGI
jgi:hypothetical protein